MYLCALALRFVRPTPSPARLALPSSVSTCPQSAPSTLPSQPASPHNRAGGAPSVLARVAAGRRLVLQLPRHRKNTPQRRCRRRLQRPNNITQPRRRVKTYTGGGCPMHARTHTIYAVRRVKAPGPSEASPFAGLSPVGFSATHRFRFSDPPTPSTFLPPKNLLKRRGWSGAHRYPPPPPHTHTHSVSVTATCKKRLWPRAVAIDSASVTSTYAADLQVQLPGPQLGP